MFPVNPVLVWKKKGRVYRWVSFPLQDWIFVLLSSSFTVNRSLVLQRYGSLAGHVWEEDSILPVHWSWPFIWGHASGPFGAIHHDKVRVSLFVCMLMVYWLEKLFVCLHVDWEFDFFFPSLFICVLVLYWSASSVKVCSWCKNHSL